jgi:hypothetical protein
MPPTARSPRPRTTVKTTREGKRYKDWLFARVDTAADSPIDVIQGGASLIMRDVVRDYIRTEHPPSNTDSLDEPLLKGESITLLDLLPAQPDPASDVCLREYECLAAGHADELLPAISGRERAAIAAKSLGIPLNHPEVEKAANCRKTALNKAYNFFVVRTASHVRDRYPGEDPECVLTLALFTVRHIAQAILSKINAESPLHPLFKVCREHSQ